MYAGFCLEKMPTMPVSRFRQAEREQLIIRCFELSGDISLLQLQERQVVQSIEVISILLISVVLLLVKKQQPLPNLWFWTSLDLS